MTRFTQCGPRDLIMQDQTFLTHGEWYSEVIYMYVHVIYT